MADISQDAIEKSSLLKFWNQSKTPGESGKLHRYYNQNASNNVENCDSGNSYPHSSSNDRSERIPGSKVLIKTPIS